ASSTQVTFCSCRVTLRPPRALPLQKALTQASARTPVEPLPLAAAAAQALFRPLRFQLQQAQATRPSTRPSRSRTPVPATSGAAMAQAVMTAQVSPRPHSLQLALTSHVIRPPS